jgi:hypothetical protein
MDLKQYYARIREAEATLESDFVVVTSCETPDGGRAGITSEVARALAAKMIVEQRARLASEAERQEFHQRVSVARKVAEQAAAASRVQVHVISDSELRSARRKE